MWKLFHLSAETCAEWVHNVLNDCISSLKNITFAKPSLDFPLGIPYLHMRPHGLLIRDGFFLNSSALIFQEGIYEIYSVYPQKQVQHGRILLLMNALAL